MRRLLKLRRDERGATAVEYGLILALVFLAMVGAVATFASTTTTMWNDVATKVKGS
ncbi:Flp family type IVb pilin [Sphingosinicella sp.]|uniref:Flp family type IVb pilin n=1 Tax=Sphingosinicella sp. TaxID=1917971 RepID=UPI004037C811